MSLGSLGFRVQGLSDRCAHTILGTLTAPVRLRTRLEPLQELEAILQAAQQGSGGPFASMPGGGGLLNIETRVAGVGV